MRLRRDVTSWPPGVAVMVVLSTIVASLGFDHVDTARRTLGDRGPMMRADAVL